MPLRRPRRARFEEHRRRVRADSSADTITFRFICADGRKVWLEQTSRAEFDATGRVIRVKGLTRDITSRKQAKKRQDLLSAELDHRVKNVLARVAAVVRQTRHRSRTTDDFVNAIDGRIQSIAAAHALLSQNRWSGVSLTDLMRHQLAPYTTDTNTTISGPDVTLASAQTQAVAMVIHELVTNAAKHGALSSPDGRVSVSWDRPGPGYPTTRAADGRSPRRLPQGADREMVAAHQGGEYQGRVNFARAAGQYRCQCQAHEAWPG